MALLGLCVCILGPLILRDHRRQAKQERINEAARAIRDVLHTPADAVVLDEVQTDDLLAYASGCTGTVIRITYGVKRPFNEVLADYHQVLLEDQWRLHSGYHQSEDYAVYFGGPQVKLSINNLTHNLEENEPLLIFTPTPMPPAASQFTIIYRITITYTEPSNRECIG